MQLFIRGLGSRSVAVQVTPYQSLESVLEVYSSRAHGATQASMMGLVYAGRQLPVQLRVCDTPLQHGSTLHAVARLPGGGGDGGSTGAESRSCYLEMYAGKKADKVNPQEEALALATRCRLSGEPLSPPCVCDELGSLFNKDAVVHAMLNKTMPASLAHIRSLKHLTNLKLEPVAGAGGSSSNGAATVAGSNQPSTSRREVQFQCPITGVELNGRFKFVVHKPSGRVLSERGLKEIPAVAEELLGGKWGAEDIVPINPSGKELETLTVKVQAQMAAEQSKKKSKKSKAGAATAAVAEEPARSGSGSGASSSDRHDVDALGSKRAAEVASAAVAGAAPKRCKAMEHMPAHATPAVYASLFVSSRKQPEVDNYLCRNAGSRGFAM